LPRRSLPEPTAGTRGADPGKLHLPRCRQRRQRGPALRQRQALGAQGQRQGALRRRETKRLEVVSVVAVVDRQAGGGEAIEVATASPFQALVTIDELYPDRPDRG
jgi:hypothetical protein